MIFILRIMLILTGVYKFGASVKIAGDLELIGLFAIHDRENDKCGSNIKVGSVMALEAVKWYIQQLNLNATLPVSIGFRALETCRLTEKAAEHAINVMDRVLNNESYIIGVVGPEFSSEAEVVSPILSSVPADFRLAQVGFSTTAVSLSDGKKYPNFVRMVPDDDVQVETMVLSMVELNWNRIAVIYANDTYGRNGYTRLKERTSEESICIALSRGISVENGVNSFEISNVLNDIMLVTGSRPPIGGIVFFGDFTTARTIFITLKNSGLSTVPILMLSEGFNMNIKAFKELDGTVISKAKGALGLSPPFRYVEEFQTHWKGIFTNASVYQQESSSNPWIREVYYDVTKCLEKNCDFKAMTDSAYNSEFGRQPLYIQYAILATHALIKATVNVHSGKCSASGFCDDFKQKFRPADILHELRGMKIDLKTDFKFRLNSLANGQLTQTISSTGQLILPTTSPAYQLYNFRKINNVSTEFDLIKVGELINSKINLTVSEIRDYTNQDAEQRWPNVRVPQCQTGQKCLECIALTEMFESVIHDPGDLYIIGLIPIFDSSGIDGCGNIRTVSGYQAAESIRFAVQKVNAKNGDYATLFQGVKLGVIILNSCNSPTVIQRKIHDLYKYGLHFQNGTVIDLNNKILGFVGDIGSTISISVAEVLSRLGLVQISFASTSPALSDRGKYPYFMRVVTPDDSQAKAMIEIVEEYDANFIQIVYSVETYGEGGRDKVKLAAKEHQICVINEIPVAEDGNPNEIYEILRKNKHARIVIVFLRSHKILPIMSTLADKMTKGEFIFIGSEAWNTNIQTLESDPKQALLGSITLSLEMYQDTELKTHIQNLTPLPFKINPWVTSFLQAKRKCYFEDSFDKSNRPLCPEVPDSSGSVLDAWDTTAFVAARSLLIGASAFFQLKCGQTTKQLCTDFTANPKGLVEEILKTKLDLEGSGTKIKVFSTNGDGNIGYRIYNIHKDDDNPQKLVYVGVGRYPLEGTFTFEKSRIVYPTQDELVSVCPNEQVCAECIQKPPSAGTGDNSEKQNGGMIGLGVALAVAVLAIIILSVIIACWRRKIIAKDNEIYIHPMPSSEDYNRDYPKTRLETLGSEAEGFQDIPPCMGDNYMHDTTGTIDMAHI